MLDGGPRRGKLPRDLPSRNPTVNDAAPPLAYLVVLGINAIAVTLAAPNGLWGLVLNRLPIAFFGIERRWVSESIDPAATSATNAAAREGQ